MSAYKHPTGHRVERGVLILMGIVSHAQIDRVEGDYYLVCSLKSFVWVFRH